MRNMYDSKYKTDSKGKISKGKISPITGPRCPERSRKLGFSDYVIMARDGGMVVSLTHRPLLPQGKTPGTHFC